jgi:hypothetical protein
VIARARGREIAIAAGELDALRVKRRVRRASGGVVSELDRSAADLAMVAGIETLGIAARRVRALGRERG